MSQRFVEDSFPAFPSKSLDLVCFSCSASLPLSLSLTYLLYLGLLGGCASARWQFLIVECLYECLWSCMCVWLCVLGATDKNQGEEPACRHILATAVIARRSCALALRHLLLHRKPTLWHTTPPKHTKTHRRARTRTSSVLLLLHTVLTCCSTVHIHPHTFRHQVNCLKQKAHGVYGPKWTILI